MREEGKKKNVQNSYNEELLKSTILAKPVATCRDHSHETIGMRPVSDDERINYLQMFNNHIALNKETKYVKKSSYSLTKKEEEKKTEKKWEKTKKQENGSNKFSRNCSELTNFFFLFFFLS